MFKKIKSANKTKLIGMIAIFISLLLVGFALKNLLSDDEEKEYKEIKTDKEIMEETYTGSDGQVDKEKAESKMNLEIKIDKKIEEKIPDMERLTASMENYLTSNGLWEDVRSATCLNVITVDFNQNIILLSFDLDNKAQNKVDATIYLDNNTYSFNYY